MQAQRASCQRRALPELQSLTLMRSKSLKHPSMHQALCSWDQMGGMGRAQLDVSMSFFT